MTRTIVKCSRCGKDTHDFSIGKPICTWCNRLIGLKSAENIIADIHHYLSSGKALRDLRPFDEWQKRRKVEIEFKDKSDPLKDGMGEDVHILVTPSLFLGSKTFVLVGADLSGWWRRHGWMNIDSYGSKRTHHLNISSADLNFEREFKRLRRDEALACGVIEAMRPLL